MSSKHRTVWTFVFVTFVIENLRSTDALKTGHTCSCATGCDFTQYCASSGDCRKVNVALGRPAEMSSNYSEYEPSGPACVAVNGNTNSVYQPMFNGESNPNCIHTGENDQNAWWLVTLAHKYTITEVVVYFRIHHTERMDNVVIMVDDQECYTFPKGMTRSPLHKTIYCISPRRGSVLKLYKNGTGQPEYYLNVCEVQIWVCRPGLYGENCDRFCNCQNNAACDSLSGMCNSDCEPGYNGEDCNYQCGYCRGGAACNITDGKCPNGCDIAYMPPFCKEVCKEGHYGLNCSQKCGNCILGISCNVFSGVCQYGCQDGLLPPFCKETCKEGYYGLNCSQKCGKCILGMNCNATSGVCQYGCEVGFHPPLCKESHTCSCATGCDFTQYCASRGDCRKVNVALGRPAEMSSNYSEYEPSGPACVAVNGNTNSVYQPMFNGESNPNCIHTGVNDQNAWWLVTLARKYTITEVVVYFRIHQTKRMDNVVIMVDDQECYTFPNGMTNSPLHKTIYCISPRRGSVLKLYKNGIGQPEYYLNVCEVQIWVCRPGLYGENCDRFCNCQSNAACDNLSGMCNSDCEPGYNGVDCIYQCGYCRGGAACNITDGKCPDGCDIAYMPPFCKEVCKEGHYGLNCSQKCGNCILSISCNVFSGVCQYGCQDGFLPPFCKETCKEEYYGLNCSQKCGNCKLRMSCNATSGVCQYGCEVGFHPPLCKEKCSPGTWGFECKSKCGNCNGSVCRHDNGSCETGCIPGFEGDLCTALLDQKSDMVENRAVLGAIIGGSLFVGVSILTAIMIWLCWIPLAQNDSGRISNENTSQSADARANENTATGGVISVVRNVGRGVEGAKRYTVFINKKQDGKEPNHIDLDSDCEDMSSVYQNI